MNSSDFMDKQILALSGSQKADLLDLVKSDEEHKEEQCSKEEVLPCYDFQPIRSVVASNADVTRLSETRRSNSGSSRNSVVIGLDEPVKTTTETGRLSDALVAELEMIMKGHVDSLMLVLKRLGTQTSQLEVRTRHLESSLDDMKMALANNHGALYGKLRQLENMLMEVQTTVQVMRDKQEIVEARRELTKLQISNEVEQLVEEPNSVQTNLLKQPVYQSRQSCEHPSVGSQPESSCPPNILLPSQQNELPLLQSSDMLPQSQISGPPTARAYLPSQQVLETEPGGYQMPSQHSHVSMDQLCQIPSHQSSFSPPSLLPQALSAPPHVQPTQNFHAEGIPYVIPAQAYQSNPPPSSLPQASARSSEGIVHMAPTRAYQSNPHPTGSLPQAPAGPELLPFHGPGAYACDAPRSVPAHWPSYGPSLSGSNTNDTYAYVESPHRYNAPSSKQSAPPGLHLPVAQLLPQAPPIASSAGGGLNTGNASNRVPVEDVIDKVTTMGFPRDRVRATVKKLTENGQSVDLNVVLDRLMNDGEVQPQKGWFGR